MICRDFPIFYSTQVDGQASEAEQVALQSHLRECITCRRSAAEIRALRSDLRALAPPQSKTTLTGEIQIALRNEAEARARQARRRADWIEAWRTRLFSQGIGAAVSISMFLFIASGVFRPAYSAIESYRTVALAQAPSLPVFSPNVALLSVGASLSEDEQIIAMVKVKKDGRALINQIVAPFSGIDPSILAKFSYVIAQQASFQPVRDENANSDAVLILIAIDVPGRASI